MKKTLAIVLLLGMTSCTLAQNISKLRIGDKPYLVVDMNSETPGYENVQALFDIHDAQTLLRRITKFSAKARKWADKGKSRPIPGTINVTHLHFTYDGGKDFSEGYFMVPSLQVGQQGDSYLQLRGYYKGYNTTPAAESLAAGDKVRYQQKCEYNYNMRIPLSQIDRWCADVQHFVVANCSESRNCL